MGRRSLLPFLVLNIVVTFAVTSLIILLRDNSLQNAPPKVSNQPLVVIVTATPNPNAQPAVTYIVVTATGGAPSSGGISAPQITPPPGLELPTLDPALIPTLDSAASPAAEPTDPSGCPTYTIKKGDILGGIANSFGVSLQDLMLANNLSDKDVTRLKIGQVLKVPLQGCGLPTPEPTITPTKFIVPTAPPTSTIIPTAASANLSVVQIVGAGDITSEGIEFLNSTGDSIEIGGWTLTTDQGDTFTFPDYLMFNERRVIVYTRAGTNTPFALYWGLSNAIYGSKTGKLTLKDNKGTVKLVYDLSAN